jgi:hypothetical protein
MLRPRRYRRDPPVAAEPIRSAERAGLVSCRRVRWYPPPALLLRRSACACLLTGRSLPSTTSIPPVAIRTSPGGEEDIGRLGIVSMLPVLMVRLFNSGNGVSGNTDALPLMVRRTLTRERCMH